MKDKVEKLEKEVKVLKKILIGVVEVCDNNFHWLRQKFEAEEKGMEICIKELEEKNKKLRENLEKLKQKFSAEEKEKNAHIRFIIDNSAEEAKMSGWKKEE